MNRFTGKPISVLLLIPLVLLMALALACTENETATAVPVTPTDPTAAPSLPEVAADTVELSVLIDPLDVGYVEVVGS